ncbi:hypothetical protein SAMN05443635_11915 [Roseobacter denitrificans OCh 114]|uniref:Uncharacterized protein n=1 Tax=Roseobacter denitrificans (strain ATCC 33942 / OCh 114) TaxID=375451 RepID=Q163F5_ROSDO|nr:hypothetical protein RD1_3396 [Roseobacter denitrificans OCh 114]SFG45383.1 hypothetical protein SAMN05443635_11915 [Roseobacter denitrificans OCh 114]
MIETPTDEKTRAAMERAHQERSQVLVEAWRWLFPSKVSR